MPEAHELMPIPGLPGYRMSFAGQVFAPEGRIAREFALFGSPHVVVRTPRPALVSARELWARTWNPEGRLAGAH
jgi:hypothetical protein